MPVLLLFLLGSFCITNHASAVDSGSPLVSEPTISLTSSENPAPSVAPADPLSTLDAAQLQALFQWLSQHAVDPAALSQEALNRAALRSLLTDPRTGAVILKNQASAAPLPEATIPPLHAQLGADAAYARAGKLTEENVAALSSFLTALPPEVTTLLLDLRAALPHDPLESSVREDPPAVDPGGQNVRPPKVVREAVSLAGAAALVSLFLPEKTPLYQLMAPPAAPVLQGSAAAPVWTRRVWLLVDHQTPPPAELAAHLLVRHLNALTFGSPTSGILTETIDRPLGPHHHIRLPSTTVSWPDGTRLTGTPLLPKITVQPCPASRQNLLTLTDLAGLPALLTETDRPRPNEAALMAGTPPELLTTPTGSASTAGRVSPDKSMRPEPVLQQAADLLHTAAFLKLDAPEVIKRAQLGK